MDYILETVPFTNCDDEPRLHDIIQSLIENGEVPEYKDFTQESDKKKQRRKRKVSEQLPELTNTLYEILSYSRSDILDLFCIRVILY